MTTSRSDEAKAWRKLYKRAAWTAIKARHRLEHPLCHLCAAEGRVNAASVVNHKTLHKGDEALFFAWENTEHICPPHHDGYIAQQERGGWAGACDDLGFPTDPKHPINVDARKRLSKVDL